MRGSEAWRIAWMAYDHNIQWVPHGWNTAIGLAADLHLSAAMPVARYVEYLTPSPYLDEIITEPFRVDAEGYLPIPTKPGLGIELNREAMKRFGVGGVIGAGRCVWSGRVRSSKLPEPQLTRTLAHEVG